MNRTIYYVYSDLYGEQEFFFDENKKILTWWDCNDASFRSEYMNPLFKALGIEVTTAKCKGEFRKAIVEVLKETFGCSDDEFEE